jgi:hypothetical protein
LRAVVGRLLLGKLQAAGCSAESAMCAAPSCMLPGPCGMSAATGTTTQQLSSVLHGTISKPAVSSRRVTSWLLLDTAAGAAAGITILHEQ